MKFKVYGWVSLYRQSGVVGEKYWTLDVSLIPSVAINMTRHDFLPDGDCLIRRNGFNVCVMVSWVCVGFTLDFRFGRDTGYWPGHDEE